MLLKSSKNSNLFILAICALFIITLFAVTTFTKKKKVVIEVPKIVQKTELNSFQITLKEKHYKKIKRKRNKSLADGIMETNDNDYVPAIITFNGTDYKADIRLKGDWTDHLEGSKWSYRIKLKGNKTILGMRKFSIHHPKTRGYINEWLFHKVNKQEGLIGLRYHFVEGFLHVKRKKSSTYISKNVGIYALEESFDKRTIESNGRKESVILRISEKYFWQEVKQSWQIGKQTGLNPRKHRRGKFQGSSNEYISTFGLRKVLKDSTLHKQFIHAKNLLELYRTKKLKASEVFDVKKLALHTVINNLFGAYHGMAAINTRFYYNPTTSKLEPIAYDGNAGHEIKKFHHYLFTNPNNDVAYTKSLISAIEKVSDSMYLDTIFKTYISDFKKLESILKPEFGNYTIIKKEVYRHNQSILKQELIRLKK